MNCNSKNDIVNLISRRDNISLNEAENLVDEVVENIHYFAAKGDFMAVEDLMMYDLNLELDYLPFYYKNLVQPKKIVESFYFPLT